jgi:hypothetical protein
MLFAISVTKSIKKSHKDKRMNNNYQSSERPLYRKHMVNALNDVIQAPRLLLHSVLILRHDFSNYPAMTQVELETPSHLQELDGQGQGQQSLEFFAKVAGFLLGHHLLPFLDMNAVSGGSEVTQLKMPEKTFLKK